MTDDIRRFHEIVAGQSDNVVDYAPTLTPTGDFNKISGINVLISSIRTLLLTNLGFYPFDPTYGSTLYKKVFDHLDQDTIDGIEYEVRDRILEFDNRVHVSKVEIFIIGKSEKGVQVNIYISKDKIKGVVTLNLPNSDQEFGLESE